MALENKLGITSSAELAREEEKKEKKKKYLKHKKEIQCSMVSDFNY